MSEEAIESIVDEFYAIVDRQIQELNAQYLEVYEELKAQGNTPDTELLRELWDIEQQIAKLHAL